MPNPETYTLELTGEELSEILSRKNYCLSTWDDVIAENTDLNTMLTVGTYHAETNAIAATVLNLPDNYTASGQAFKLVVEYTSTTNFLLQTLIGRTGVIYVRSYNASNTTFSAWQKLLTTSDATTLQSQITALEARIEVLEGGTT